MFDLSSIIVSTCLGIMFSAASYLGVLFIQDVWEEEE